MDKKSHQLGMNFSTASYRLDRMILLRHLQELGKDRCYRCGEKIERWEDLSTEHKVAWQDVSVALFWDLSNIAFSHKGCNYRAAGVGKIPANSRFNKAPQGMAWCSDHGDYLPVGSFTKNKRSKNGLDHYCKSCKSKRTYPEFASDPER